MARDIDESDLTKLSADDLQYLLDRARITKDQAADAWKASHGDEEESTEEDTLEQPDFENMTKAELTEYGAALEPPVELNDSMTKADMIAALEV